MSWYNSGYDGINKEEQRLQSLSGPNRLWMPPGTGKDLVVVDDEAFCIHEHNAKLNGHWRNQHTCNKGLEDACESCSRLGDKSKAYVGYLTMVDCSLYTDKKGNKYQYEVKLVGAKIGILKKWRRKKEERGSLVLTKVKTHREDDKKSSIGDEWEFGETVKDEAKIFELANYKGKKLSELWDKADANEQTKKLLGLTFQIDTGPDGKLVRRVVPFNYMEVLKPRGNEFVRDLLGGVTKEEALGSDDKKSDVVSEDEIPF
jgi:hypothetical protein